MADKSGCLVGVLVNAGPVTIKFSPNAEFDPEIGLNRAIISGTASCTPRTVTTTYGGIIRGVGYLDPADAGCALILAANAGGADLTAVKYIVDMSVNAGSRSGFSLGNSKLIPKRFIANIEENGMQAWEIEIHSQAGTSYSTTL